MPNIKKEGKGYFGINWGRQGGVIALYIVVVLGYYGIIANTVMFDQYGRWISFTEMNRSFLISAAAYKLVSAYREGGVDEAVKLLEHQLSVYANNKNISLDKNEVEE